MAAGSSAAIAISALALSEAETAKCIASVKGYQHDTASVAQMQQYASCIGRLHPNDLSPDALIAAKVIVALLFVGVIFGLIWGWRDNYSPGIMDVVMGGLVGLLVAAGGMLAVAGVWYGIEFLMS